jgi:hypothetical protein
MPKNKPEVWKDFAPFAHVELHLTMIEAFNRFLLGRPVHKLVVGVACV